MASFDPRTLAPMSDPLDYQQGGVEPVSESVVERETQPSTARFIFFNAVPSWIVSLIFHFLLLIAMALVGSPEATKEVLKEIIVQRPDEEVVEELQEMEIPLELTDEKVLENSSLSDDISMVIAPTTEVIEVSDMQDVEAATIDVELVAFSDNTIAASDLLSELGGSGKGLGGGRTDGKVKGDMVKKGGGSDATEAAVANALDWIVRHQQPDGGWNFDHTIGPGVRTSSDPGTASAARNGATAMALLPLLGAGMTHKEGKYKENVTAGLAYLLKNHKAQRNAISFHEPAGSMYSHGLVAITLCEAYAMTQDKQLAQPAQLSLNYIVSAQDPIGGGWRYQPKQPGDTSAVGWQIMALKSGHLGYLDVPEPTVRSAIKFLDGVSMDGGAYYGYTDPGNGPATTAVGLLCRMYLGWKKDNPALMRGVKYLSDSGPSIAEDGKSGNMYYNYYATQVLRQYGGEEWDKWNGRMSKVLVATQGKTGPETGSWHMSGGASGHGAEQGGRLYSTSLSTMILEVYYRHLPIYKAQAAEQDFAL